MYFNISFPPRNHKNFEEILCFQHCIFLQISTMNSVLDSIISKHSSYCIRSEGLRYLWIIWATKLPELVDSVLLSDF